MGADAYGLPIEFMITGTEVHDCKIAPESIVQLPFVSNYTIADKGYDKEALRDITKEKGSIPMIPKKSNSKTGRNDMDWGLSKTL